MKTKVPRMTKMKTKLMMMKVFHVSVLNCCMDVHHPMKISESRTKSSQRRGCLYKENAA